MSTPYIGLVQTVIIEFFFLQTEMLLHLLLKGLWLVRTVGYLEGGQDCFFKELMEFQWGTMNPVEEAYSEAHGILAENV